MKRKKEVILYYRRFLIFAISNESPAGVLMCYKIQISKLYHRSGIFFILVALLMTSEFLIVSKECFSREIAMSCRVSDCIF